jgi:hypothetical protein
MINTKNLNKTKEMAITPDERKAKVNALREEHEDYFQTNGIINALYIPKMAYRPAGKDELYISFFPSEFEKNEDIYTEFVSINYDTEDPKRTLYLHKHNPHWREEYELIESSTGFIRHIIPVNELKIINDVTNRGKLIQDYATLNLQFANPDLPDPDKKEAPGLVEALLDINKTLKAIQLTLNSILNK